MCGISGEFAYRGTGGIDPARCRVVRDYMSARGPDGAGEWSSPADGVWLGHRRLAIIDLSASANQPMASADGVHVVTFNGEIYNYRELRERLIAEGCTFRTQSDTEVILHLYRRKGPACVSELRGMFAFALWDGANACLILARDPYGIKPLYYYDDGRRLLFASQVKALTADTTVATAPDPAGLVGFLLFGSIPEPFTVHAGIRAVPAGSTLVIDRNGLRAPAPYCAIPAIIRHSEMETGGTEQDRIARLRSALLDSVRHHLVADVPVGAFLSAGVDSGALVGLMRDAGQTEIRTVTLTYAEFEGGRSDEGPLASETAALYGTRHTIRRVGAAEFHADLPRIVAAMDQPSIDGINTWFVSKAAREFGLKVAVSGVGGDELLGGYNSFDLLPRIRSWTRFAPGFRSLSGALEWSVGRARHAGVGLHPKWAGLLRHGGDLPGAYLLQRSLFLPAELDGLLADPAFVREGLDRLAPHHLLEQALQAGPQTPFGQVAALESTFYLRNQLLRDTDWAGMAHSLEVRTPFVDHVLLAQAAAVMSTSPRPNGKAILANAPRLPLPSNILDRSKTGFGVPLRAWLEKPSPRDAAGPRSDGLFSRKWAMQIAAAQPSWPPLNSAMAQ